MSSIQNNERTIWRNLKSRGLNDYAVAGIMGNLYAESGLQSAVLEALYRNKFGMTSEEYTAAVDNGSYRDEFVKDHAGYGLAQWTYGPRKKALLKYKDEFGSSIGDLIMQLGFLWQELQGYTGVMNVLQHAGSVREVSDVILLQYECPADRSEAVKVKRASYGQKYYESYAKNEPAPTPAPAPVPQPPSPKPNDSPDSPSPKKSVDEIAREVIQGLWGNGDERRQRLTAAGYSYEEVRTRVNELLK